MNMLGVCTKCGFTKELTKALEFCPKCGAFMKIESSSSLKGCIKLKPRPYKYPYDPAGFYIHKYPKAIGLDPSKIRCINCRHWDEKEWFCLYLKRRTNPQFRCADFGRKGL
ncbi:hypothetical protein KEJ20_02790 [Candidatus Bathyarchaeota archaeon]|nr:hypothetical protein [Candidatus Bathyarchaeota archaeon]